jgi:hypothetical protein
MGGWREGNKSMDGLQERMKGVGDGDMNEIIFPKRPILGMCSQVMTRWWDVQGFFCYLKQLTDFPEIECEHYATGGHPKFVIFYFYSQ